MDDQEKIDLILDYAETHPTFDIAFVESLQQQLSYKSLSLSQSDALERIIETFRMEKWQTHG